MNTRYNQTKHQRNQEFRTVSIGAWLRAVKIVFVGLLISGLSLSASAATLIDPPAVESWGCELSTERVLQGIVAGLVGRGWIIKEKTSSNSIVAQVIVRSKYILVVDIEYSGESYDINYKSSDNLGHRDRSDGEIQIHRNANSCMNNIQNDILSQLSAACVLEEVDQMD